MRYPCFFLEETDTSRLFLRRYKSSSDGQCPVHGYHDASVFLKDVPSRKEPVSDTDSRMVYASHSDQMLPKDDPRWPVACDCGYVFASADEWQVFADALYQRLDTGEILARRAAPPGALWMAWWMKGFKSEWTGPDGEVLMCRTPGGDWNIDSRASNCTMPQDNTHRCWVRHGDPRDPLGLKSGKPLHVDKGGHTCQAGAGSIQCNSYHGFLHAGHLTEG